MTDNHNPFTGNASPITTQPEPLRLGRAAQALDAVLAGDLDVETRLAVGAALAVAELAAAVENAGSVEEAIRAGLAARELRRIGARP